MVRMPTFTAMARVQSLVRGLRSHSEIARELKKGKLYITSVSEMKLLLLVVNAYVLVTQPCPTLCNPTDRSPPGSSVHGILQARILEWVAISFSRGSSPPRDRTQVSCIAGRCFTV